MAAARPLRRRMRGFGLCTYILSQPPPYPSLRLAGCASLAGLCARDATKGYHLPAFLWPVDGRRQSLYGERRICLSGTALPNWAEVSGSDPANTGPHRDKSLRQPPLFNRSRNNRSGFFGGSNDPELFGKAWSASSKKLCHAAAPNRPPSTPGFLISA